MLPLHRLPLTLIFFVLTLIALAHFRGSIFHQTQTAPRKMATSYPQIVVTGDSISQQAFKIGGYAAALVDAVSQKPAV
jgi:hypothetical protein